MSCLFKNCMHSKSFHGSQFSFHLFPREDSLLKRWLKILGIDVNNWTWTRSKFICSDHFFPDDFITKGGKKCLKVTAVPHLSEKLLITNAAATNSRFSNDSGLVSPSGSKTGERKLQQKLYISPSKLKNRIIQLKEQQQRYRRKLFTVNSKIIKLKREVSDLTMDIRTLQEKHYLSENILLHLDKNQEHIQNI